MHRGASDQWLDKRSAIGSVVRVTKEYRPWTPEQAFLLPPSPLDWLPEGHLAYFVLELVRELDVSAIEHALQSKEARGGIRTWRFQWSRLESIRISLRSMPFGCSIGMRSAACSPKCSGSATRWPQDGGPRLARRVQSAGQCQQA